MAFQKYNKINLCHGFSYTKTYLAFYNHKRSATARGIEFKFDLFEWVQWWEENLGPNWEMLRGNKRGQYCMARKRDIGPYSVNNVECLINAQNQHDRIKNGTSPVGSRNGRAKLNENLAQQIFIENGTILGLSKKYGVSRPVIQGIKDKTLWAAATKGLV